MLNNSALKRLGITQITAMCQLSPQNDYTLHDTAPEKNAFAKCAQQTFAPLTISLSARANLKNVYVGELEGHIIEFWKNYGTPEDPVNIEKLAFLNENTPIMDFTLSILREDGTLPHQWSTHREWCRNGFCFALVHKISISEEYRNTGLEPFLLDSLHNIIHHDCCIRIESLFIPVSIILSATKTKLRKQGFTRLGGSDNGYLARHSQAQGLLCHDAMIA